MYYSNDRRPEVTYMDLRAVLREVREHLEGDVKTWDLLAIKNPISPLGLQANFEAQSDRKLIDKINEVI